MQIYLICGLLLDFIPVYIPNYYVFISRYVYISNGVYVIISGARYNKHYPIKWNGIVTKKNGKYKLTDELSNNTRLKKISKLHIVII